MPRLPLLTVLLVILACSSDPTNPPVNPADVRVSPSHVFAGGEVFLSGDWYRTTDSLPGITAGASFLAVRRVNDTTVAATLPSTANGIVKLGELSPGALYDRGSVTVHGFKRHASVPVPNHFELTTSWDPNSPFIAIDTDSGLSVLDPRVDTVTSYLGIGSLGTGHAGCPFSAGPSYRPNVFVLADSGFPGRHDFWSILPDTAWLGPAPIGGCMVAEIAPGLYAHDGQTFVNVYQLDSAGQAVSGFQQGMAMNHRFIKSPAGDRLAIAAYSPAGATVVNLASMTSAFTAPAMETVYDAAFNADGSRLYLTGGAFYGEVLGLNATTGDSLASAFFGSDQPFAITHDPLRGVIYVAVAERDSLVGARLSIHVLDEVTLVQLGRLQLPDAAGCGFCFIGSRGVLWIDQPGSELMLVMSFGGVEIYHFSLPPVP